MAVLTEEQKLFIVCRLACMRTPSQVAGDVEEEFGVKLDRMQVRSYNPLQSPDAKKKWLAIFTDVRQKFLNTTEGIPIAHLHYRLAVLDRIARLAEGEKMHPLVLQALEQAAKDAGGAFTSRRDVTVKDPDEVLARLLGVTKEELP